MKRWPTMPVAPRIPTGSLFDMASCDFIPAKILAGNAVAGTTDEKMRKVGWIGDAARSSITRWSDGRLARRSTGKCGSTGQIAGLDARFEVGRVPAETSTR